MQLEKIEYNQSRRNLRCSFKLLAAKDNKEKKEIEMVNNYICNNLTQS
jgi:hypothetical protein